MIDTYLTYLRDRFTAARDLLMRGEFVRFFQGCKRDDLVRAANDAKAQANPDIGLTTLLGAADDIRGIKPPVAIPNGWFWLWLALGGLGVAALSALAWRYWQKHRARPGEPHPRCAGRTAASQRRP